MKLNIRTRLTLKFTYIVAFILTLFSLIIYYFSASYRESEFYSRLKNKAFNTARLLLDVQEIDHDLLKIIDKNTINALNAEEVMIFNSNNKLIYSNLDNDSIPIPAGLLEKIRLKKEIHFHDEKSEVVGLLYAEKGDHFVVLASALDKYGRSKLNFLKWILIIGFFISIGLTIFLGQLYSENALRPMSEVVQQVEKITIFNLHTRVNEGNGTDEIAQLAITFNDMLQRLESAFETQRSFISNASHEFRTPLTSMRGQIEVSLMKLRTSEEYIKILQSVLEDINNLNDLSNGLLNLANASADIAAMSFQIQRIDEIIWESREDLIKRKKDFNVLIRFSDHIDDEKSLQVFGNFQLLKTAIINLMDNACKFSPNNTVEVFLSLNERNTIIRFTDQGMGIVQTELEKIFQPFYRGSNARTVSGNGLGLSLAYKIIALHKGELSINSQVQKGTMVTLSIPCLC